MPEQRAKAGTGKVTFASPEWIEAACAILRELVAAHGKPDACFSLCEEFTEAPADVAPSGTALWHFAVKGQEIVAGPGDLHDADVRICEKWAKALPVARLVYSHEIITAMEREGRDPFGAFPSYLVELHNRLALITA